MKRSTQPARKFGKKLLQLRSLIEATVNNTKTHPSPLALPALSLKSLESKFADGLTRAQLGGRRRPSSARSLLISDYAAALAFTVLVTER